MSDIFVDADGCPVKPEIYRVARRHEHVADKDIVVTGDIPLAARCLQKGAAVLDTRGGLFSEESIGDALASRALMSHLRDLGGITGGPAAFDKRDRSRFLHRLDETIRSVLRKK